MSLARIALVLVVLTGTALAASTAVAAPARCTRAGPDVACTKLGAVRGVVEDDVIAFKGMPYAQPPVGALRWRPTEAATPWTGVRDGSRFGAMCPQVIGRDVKGDEDCLYVNVWTPKEKPAKPLPVMIWLTGGGNHSLSGEGTPGFAGLRYDGTNFVPQGVVFVSYNLRLNVLGFLAHPAFDAERREKVSGNYGSLDQVAMLHWVKDNIAAFGGDPKRVFLFGTSAGGGNICALMTSPLTKGLIHGVAMQSSVPSGCELQTLADAEAGTGAKIAAAMHCDATPDVAACLRGKSATELVAAMPGTFTVLPRLYGPNVDGVVFPSQPIARIAKREYPAMPIIIGNTYQETNPWGDTAGKVTDEASYAAAIETTFAGARDRILARYPAKSYATPRAAFVRVTTDALFTCQSRRVARTFAQVQMEPVYRYLFSDVQENDPALKAAGAAHTVEHAFLFPGSGNYVPTTTDREVTRRMVDYWTRMARTDDPNGAPEPEWPVVTTANSDAYLQIGPDTAARQGPPDAQCDFWDGVKLPSPHM